MRPFSSGRAHFGIALLIIALCLLAFMVYLTTAVPGPTVTEAYAGAEIHYEISRAAVFWNNACVDLSWKLEGIFGVWLDDNPKVGVQTDTWCLPPPETYRGFYRDPARPDLRLQFTSGEVRHYQLPVFVMQPFLLRLVLPLVLIAGVVLTYPLLPYEWREWLTKPRLLSHKWQTRLQLANLRKPAALVLLAYAMITIGVIVYRVGFAPPYTYTRTDNEATFQLIANPQTVFWSDDCTQISWETTGIDSVVLEGAPVETTSEQEWCLPPRSSNSILQFDIETSEGKSYKHTLMIRAMQPVVGYAVIPALIAALILSGVLGWPLRPIHITEKTPAVLRAFSHNDQLDHLLFAIFLVINLLAISNMVRHNAGLAYDGEDHFLYGIILSENRLPTPEETNQFFAPPLAYVFPSIVHRALVIVGMPPCTEHEGQPKTCQIVAKAGQLQNIIPALGITYLLLLICGQIAPDDINLKRYSLALLGMLPVFYKTMVFQRGEPFVALFTLLLVHRLIKMSQPDYSPSPKDIVIFGLTTGLLALSRQWGILAAGGMGLWALMIVIRSRRMDLLRAGLIGYVVAALSGGWFYLLNWWRFGSVTAFNRAAEAGNSLLNLKPIDFYIGVGAGTLFTEAFRSARIRQIIPIFYTDLWGDYWGHFHLPSADFSVWTAPPPADAIAYMSHVNVVSLFPTAILLMGFASGIIQLYSWLRHNQDTYKPYALFQLVILVSLGGYLWFLIQYPDSVGDTIKAAYMLQIYPLLAMLTAAWLTHLRHWNEPLHHITLGLLMIITLNNLPMMITQYTGSGT